MSLEMAHKVIVPPKKNYIQKFLKQRDIGNFMYQSAVVRPKKNYIPQFLKQRDINS